MRQTITDILTHYSYDGMLTSSITEIANQIDKAIPRTPLAPFADAVAAELARARSKFPGRQHSAHEGYAVMAEEVDEVWDEVKKNSSRRDHKKMRAELVQVAAMAQRMAEDLAL